MQRMKRKAIAVAAVLIKTVLPLVAGLAVLVLVIAWLAGVFERKIAAGQGEVAVRLLPAGAATDQVHPITQEYFEEAVGTLRAASRTEISARIMAHINEIRVRAGQLVEKGAELIVLDSRDLAAKRSQAEAALVAAQAAESQAEKDYRRYVQMFQEKAVSAAQMDEVSAKVKMARANRELAAQALAEADVMLSYTTIKAPKPGMIVDQLAKEGDTARPGEPLLTLYDPKSLRLEVPVMENLAVKLKVGDPVAVYIDAREKEYPGTVDEIVPQAEAASRSFLVKVRLPRSEDLFEGMFGRLKIAAGQRRYRCLATAAIGRVGQLEFVDVVGPGNVLERRLIKTGRLGKPGRVEVLSGLSPNEVVWLKSPADDAALPSPTTAEQ
jgi:membrane fusion protein (multidrug efflux system)